MRGQRWLLAGHLLYGEIERCFSKLKMSSGRRIEEYVLHRPKLSSANDADLDRLAGCLKVGQLRRKASHIGELKDRKSGLRGKY